MESIAMDSTFHAKAKGSSRMKLVVTGKAALVTWQRRILTYTDYPSSKVPSAK